MANPMPLPHVILFEHANYHGAHKHVFDDESNLDASDDNFFNDKTSSIIVIEGNWTFYRDKDFQGVERNGRPLGPGLYPWVENEGIKNDDISSLSVQHIVGPA